MSVVAAAIVGSTIVGAGVSIYGAKKSSEAQADAAAEAGDFQAAAQERSLALQREMWETGREDTAPWREGGADAYRDLLKQIKEGPGEFNYEESPGYQFRMEEGQKAVERSAAAKGGLLGGAQSKALTRYGQGVANQDYDRQRSNFFNEYYDSLAPLQSAAGVGQTTAAGDAGRAASFGSSGSNTIMSAASGRANAALYGGDADAAKYTNYANTISGGLNSGMNNYMMWKYMQPSGPTAPPANTGMPTTYA